MVSYSTGVFTFLTGGVSANQTRTDTAAVTHVLDLSNEVEHVYY